MAIVSDLSGMTMDCKMVVLVQMHVVFWKSQVACRLMENASGKFGFCKQVAGQGQTCHYMNWMYMVL